MLKSFYAILDTSPTNKKVLKKRVTSQNNNLKKKNNKDKIYLKVKAKQKLLKKKPSN